MESKQGKHMPLNLELPEYLLNVSGDPWDPKDRPPYKTRTGNKVSDHGNCMGFLTGETSESIIKEVFQQSRERAKREGAKEVIMDFGSILDEGKDEKKIKNIANNLRNAVKSVDSDYSEELNGSVTYSVFSQRDHQFMRNNDGGFHDRSRVDEFLKRFVDNFRESLRKGVLYVYVINCKAGQGRSAAMVALLEYQFVLEKIKYINELEERSESSDLSEHEKAKLEELKKSINIPDDLLPTTIAGMIKQARPGARVLGDKKMRPDQSAFVSINSLDRLIGELKTNKWLKEELQKVVDGSEKKSDFIKNQLRVIKGMVDIDYFRRLEDPENANPESWREDLLKKIKDYVDVIKDVFKVDLLDQMLIDYAQNPSEYSDRQRFCLSESLKSNPDLEVCTDPDKCIEMLKGKNHQLPEDVQMQIANSVIRNADRSNKLWYKIFNGIAKLFGGHIRSSSLTDDQVTKFRQKECVGLPEDKSVAVEVVAVQDLRSSSLTDDQVTKFRQKECVGLPEDKSVAVEVVDVQGSLSQMLEKVKSPLPAQVILGVGSEQSDSPQQEHNNQDDNEREHHRGP